jgi:hypothetical protein
MTLELSSQFVWSELEKDTFAVLGMVTSKGEARTVGIVYIVHDRVLYIATGEGTWKARHVRENPHVSITVPIAKRIPIMPWIKIPAATITFSGTASVFDAEKVEMDILHGLFRGLETNEEMLATMCVIKVEPTGDFVTYGVGVPLMEMRHPEKAGGRAPVA